jgi:16S rRNA (uracil1498-N3)-methyltransferase
VPTVHITLFQAVGKGDKIDQVVRDATALGAKRLVVVTTVRSVPKLAERAQARRERWRQIAVAAARQSGRGDVPEVTLPLPLATALEQAPAGRRIVLDPGADVPLARALDGWSASEPLSALIGPEGGLDDSELEAARAAGFSAVRFGPFVLRTETAATALLGALVALAEPRQ